MNTELKEWTKAYLKNKDMTQKKIVKIEEDAKNNCLNVTFKDKTVKHYIIEKLEDKTLPKIENNDWKVIVCPNTEDNFKHLVKDWKKLSGINNLTFIFVNLKLQEKWQINPKLHSMIADPESIELGLKTMFDTANGKITEAPKMKKKGAMFEESSNEEDEENEE